jgi:dolichol kinase
MVGVSVSLFFPTKPIHLLIFVFIVCLGDGYYTLILEFQPVTLMSALLVRQV